MSFSLSDLTGGSRSFGFTSILHLITADEAALLGCMLRQPLEGSLVALREGWFGQNRQHRSDNPVVWLLVGAVACRSLN
jgi:hypothetical protein